MGWMRRRGQVLDGLPDRSPHAARSKRHWRDLRRPLNFPNLIVSLTRFGDVLEGYVGPPFSICARPRRLVIEIRQIWGSVSPRAPVALRVGRPNYQYRGQFRFSDKKGRQSNRLIGANIPVVIRGRVPSREVTRGASLWQASVAVPLGCPWDPTRAISRSGHQSTISHNFGSGLFMPVRDRRAAQDRCLS